MSKETLVVPVSGALTPELKLPSYRYDPSDNKFKQWRVSVAKQNFQNLYRSFREQGQDMAPPIVLPRLGLQNPYDTADSVKKSIERRLDKHNADQAWVVGLSLGGFISSYLLSKDPEGNMIAGVHTGDSPHNGASEEAFRYILPAVRSMARMGLFSIDEKSMQENIEPFKQEIWDGNSQHEDKILGRLHQLGADGQVVPVESALYPLPGSTRYLLAPFRPEDLDADVIHVLTKNTVTHMGAVSHPAAVDLIVRTTFESLDRLQSS